MGVGGSDGPNKDIYGLSAKEFAVGGYKAELSIVNQQGQTVSHNEKRICVH